MFLLDIYAFNVTISLLPDLLTLLTFRRCATLRNGRKSVLGYREKIDIYRKFIEEYD